MMHKEGGAAEAEAGAERGAESVWMDATYCPQNESIHLDVKVDITP